MKAIALPVFIMAVGIGWLLTTRGVLPGVNWVWVIGLGLAGLGVMVIGGVNTFTVVIGLWLIIATVFSLLRQTGRLSIETEVPALVIAIGALMLLAQVLPIPKPGWMTDRAK